jgi:hypothetical protein
MYQLKLTDLTSKHGYLFQPLTISIFFACLASGVFIGRLTRLDARGGYPEKPLENEVDKLQSHLDGRLDNLSRAVFDLRIGMPIPATTSSGGDEKNTGPVTPVVSVADLLQQAEKHRTNKNFREAEIVLTRAVQTNRDDVSAWRALAAVQREMSAVSIKNHDLGSAAQQADRARRSVNEITALSISPASPNVDVKIVRDEEEAMDKTMVAVRDAVDTYCDEPIAAAKQCANDAWHWYRKSSRDTIVEGLNHLRKVIELGPWSSERTRIGANEAFSELKHLVYPEEWNELLAKAGFEPGSRETLKKWGLE